MSVRPVIAMPAFEVRPSVRVGKVAAMLDDDPSQIRRMLARGELEGHREGKRGVRIYLDSIAEWQRRNPLGKTETAREARKKAAHAPRPATRAAHRQAVAHLQGLGLMPTSGH